MNEGIQHELNVDALKETLTAIQEDLLRLLVSVREVIEQPTNKSANTRLRVSLGEFKNGITDYRAALRGQPEA